MNRSFLTVPGLAVCLAAGPAAGPAAAFEFCSKAAEPVAYVQDRSVRLAQDQSRKQKRDAARSNAGGESAGAEAAESARQGRQQKTKEDRREQ